MQKLNFPLPPNEPASCSAKRSNGKVWYQFANGKWFSLHRVEFWSIVLTKELFLFRLPFNQPQMVAAKIVFLHSLYAELCGKVFYLTSFSSLSVGCIELGESGKVGGGGGGANKVWVKLTRCSGQIYWPTNFGQWHSEEQYHLLRRILSSTSGSALSKGF